MCFAVGPGATNPAAVGARARAASAAYQAAQAPPPLPTGASREVIAARGTQRQRQKRSLGYNGSTLLAGAPTAPAAPMKTLLGA